MTTFNEIQNFAKEYNNDGIIYYGRYFHGDKEYVQLGFTLHGDYIGSTVEKSNYKVLLELISEVCDLETLNGLSYSQSMGYSTYQIEITNDLPNDVWEIIKDAIESIENYPLLCDDSYEMQQLEDCESSWFSWQYQDISSELEDRNLDIDQTNLDETELLYLITDNNIIGDYNQLEITEVNCESYYSFTNEMLDKLAEYLIKKYPNCELQKAV